MSRELPHIWSFLTNDGAFWSDEPEKSWLEEFEREDEWSFWRAASLPRPTLTGRYSAASK